MGTLIKMSQAMNGWKQELEKVIFAWIVDWKCQTSFTSCSLQDLPGFSSLAFLMPKLSSALSAHETSNNNDNSPKYTSFFLTLCCLFTGTWLLYRFSGELLAVL